MRRGPTRVRRVGSVVAARIWLFKLARLLSKLGLQVKRVEHEMVRTAAAMLLPGKTRWMRRCAEIADSD
jgi:hypothetical protein